MTNHASFVSAVALKVGDPTTGIYTMYNPTSDKGYCTLDFNTIVKTDNTAWTGTVRLTGTGGNPQTSWNIDSTATVETISFKMRS